jgi:hypothetical protein
MRKWYPLFVSSRQEGKSRVGLRHPPKRAPFNRKDIGKKTLTRRTPFGFAQGRQRHEGHTEMRKRKPNRIKLEGAGEKGGAKT